MADRMQASADTSGGGMLRFERPSPGSPRRSAGLNSRQLALSEKLHMSLVA